jgi:hypothetical protein
MPKVRTQVPADFKMGIEPLLSDTQIGQVISEMALTMEGLNSLPFLIPANTTLMKQLVISASLVCVLRFVQSALFTECIKVIKFRQSEELFQK